jgi:putative oxidoreductase
LSWSRLIQPGETGPAVFHLALAAWLIWLVGYEWLAWWAQMGLSDALFPLVVAGLIWIGLWWVVRYLPGGLLTVTGRLVLGGLFVVQAWGRILDPHRFARTLIDYDLLPHQLVNLTAVTLPWFEVVVGLGLIVGLKGRLMAGLAGLLLAGSMGLSLLGLIQGVTGHGTSWANLVWLDAWQLVLAVHVLCFDDGRWAVDRWLRRS